MKIVAFTRCHYGVDYLPWVLRSTLPHVDSHLIIYTPVPTFGRYTSMPNPDTREAVYAAAQSVGSDKVLWVDGAPVEVETAFHYFPDADIVLEADADEIYQPELIEDIVRRYTDGELTAFSYRLPFLHFWRSFGYACDDAGWPVRLYLPKNRGGGETMYPSSEHRVLHFGYARSLRDMQYKWETSVHIGELRPEWWSEIWHRFPERLTDVHPVIRNWWDANPVDRSALPAVLADHPYRDLEVIK